MMESMPSHKVTDRPVEFFDTTTGRYWLPTDAAGDSLIAEIRANQVHDKHIIDKACAHVRYGATVLDIGANFGQMSVLFARLAGPEGVVHAFEADPFICSLLRRNIEENGLLKNIIVHEGAAWNEGGLTLFYPEQDFVRFEAYGSYGIDLNATEGRTVKSLTIDSLDISGDITFIKVDAQGSDLFAMMGARRTIIRSGSPVIFEFEDCFQEEFKTSFVDYVKFADDIGYRIVERMGCDHLMVPADKKVD